MSNEPSEEGSEVGVESGDDGGGFGYGDGADSEEKEEEEETDSDDDEEPTVGDSEPEESPQSTPAKVLDVGEAASPLSADEPDEPGEPQSEPVRTPTTPTLSTSSTPSKMASKASPFGKKGGLGAYGVGAKGKVASPAAKAAKAEEKAEEALEEAREIEEKAEEALVEARAAKRAAAGGAGSAAGSVGKRDLVARMNEKMEARKAKLPVEEQTGRGKKGKATKPFAPATIHGHVVKMVNGWAAEYAKDASNDVAAFFDDRLTEFVEEHERVSAHLNTQAQLLHKANFGEFAYAVNDEENGYLAPQAPSYDLAATAAAMDKALKDPKEPKTAPKKATKPKKKDATPASLRKAPAEDSPYYEQFLEAVRNATEAEGDLGDLYRKASTFKVGKGPVQTSEEPVNPYSFCYGVVFAEAYNNLVSAGGANLSRDYLVLAVLNKARDVGRVYASIAIRFIHAVGKSKNTRVNRILSILSILNYHERIHVASRYYVGKVEKGWHTAGSLRLVGKVSAATPKPAFLTIINEAYNVHHEQARNDFAAGISNALGGTASVTRKESNLYHLLSPVFLLAQGSHAQGNVFVELFGKAFHMIELDSIVGPLASIMDSTSYTARLDSDENTHFGVRIIVLIAALIADV